MTPRLLIVIKIEAAPVAIIDANNESEERRLLDWLEAHPELAASVRLAFLSAVDLMKGEWAA